jgi:hypothetical protein
MAWTSNQVAGRGATFPDVFPSIVAMVALNSTWLRHHEHRQFERPIVTTPSRESGRVEELCRLLKLQEPERYLSDVKLCRHTCVRGITFPL